MERRGLPPGPGRTRTQERLIRARRSASSGVNGLAFSRIVALEAVKLDSALEAVPSAADSTPGESEQQQDQPDHQQDDPGVGEHEPVGAVPRVADRPLPQHLPGRPWGRLVVGQLVAHRGDRRIVAVRPVPPQHCPGGRPAMRYRWSRY
jgi:hypothetical protein